jgi:aspartate aminotransferase
MTDRARDLRRAGASIVVLSAGEPDFPTPPHVVAAAHAAALAGDTKYPPLAGTRRLKEAIQNKFRRDNGLLYDPDEIAIANGSKQIMFNALMATCNPGDEVIVPVPSWISYLDMVLFAGATPVRLRCSSGINFSAADLESVMTERTKWLILNYPNNPTGATLSRRDLADLATVLLRHQAVHVISDDVYEQFVYAGPEFATIAQTGPEIRRRTLTVNSVSKTYAMTGWRVGYCGGPAELIKGVESVQGQSTSGTSTISQAAAVAALNGPQEFLADNLKIYRARRDLTTDLLNGIPGITCPRPDGAFYVFPDISAFLGKRSASGDLIRTDTDFVSSLLDEQKVATVQGSAYGAPGHIRISFATDQDSIREGCSRLAEFCRNCS